MSVLRAATWLGGPMDGRRVLIDPDSDEYAVALSSDMQQIEHPKVQRYVTDPSFWLNARLRVHEVRIYPVTRIGGNPVIHWHEQHYRSIEVSSR